MRGRGYILLHKHSLCFLCFLDVIVLLLGALGTLEFQEPRIFAEGFGVWAACGFGFQPGLPDVPLLVLAVQVELASCQDHLQIGGPRHDNLPKNNVMAL